jgi:hypothetical protein
MAAQQWPTPCANEPTGQLRLKNDREGRDPETPGSYHLQLGRLVGQWPTPVVTDSNGARNATSGRSNPDSKHHAGVTLNDAIRTWPTPAARDHRSERGGGQDLDALQPTERPEPASVHRALDIFAPGPGDPAWAGILAEHPELAPALEPTFRSVVDGLAFDMGDSRAARLKCVGNGVVALCAATAFVVLARRAGLFA